MSKAWLPWFDGWALTEIGQVLTNCCKTPSWRFADSPGSEQVPHGSRKGRGTPLSSSQSCDDRRLAAFGSSLLSERCEPILLSKAPGQSLPPTPKNWRIVDDETPEEGPLAALVTAFRAIDDDRLAGALVATCDQSPESLKELTAILLADPIADARSRIFFDGERRQPFPGYYSVASLRRIDAFREQGVTSMYAFLDAIAGETVLLRLEKAFADWDDPEAYLAAARAAGFEPPAWCREALTRSAP